MHWDYFSWVLQRMDALFLKETEKICGAVVLTLWLCCAHRALTYLGKTRSRGIDTSHFS